MAIMRAVPIGVDDFQEIRDEDGYYVDKTPLIDEILNRRLTKVHLITRPRRFGKSTNLNMLDSYLNQRYKGNTWFDDLKITELRPDDPEKNAYPVIFLNMKDVYTSSYDVFVTSVGSRISKLYGEFPEIREHLEADDPMRIRYDNILYRRADVVDLKDSLGVLSDMLETIHGRKVVILIDEYDHPLNSSYGKPFQHDIVEFIRDFLSNVLKSRKSLKFGVVTGVMQIAKESIFSGLNNLKVDNILSTSMDEMFGFTSSEVERMCSDFGHPEKFAEAREWYDGYRFGDADIYNPWSILNYVDSGFNPKPYWAGTSGNGIISDLLAIPRTPTRT